MGEQTFLKMWKKLAVLLLVFFVLQVTTVMTSAQDLIWCPRGYHPVGPTGPNGESICAPDSSIPSYLDGYAKGKDQGFIAGLRHGEARGEIEARNNMPYELWDPKKPPTVTPYNSEPFYVGVADGFRDAYAGGYNKGYERGYPKGLTEAGILNAHNKYRAEVGVPPLIWDEELAASAKRWANYLNATNPPNTRPDDPHSHISNVGENIHFADGTWTSKISTETYSWAAEKKCFKNGVFPDIYNGQCNSNLACSPYQNWQCSSHYSQMVWKNTKKIGCAKTGYFWVCQYSPPGNIYGQKAY